ncbi:MAG TPA: hypothetical protein VLV78_09550 [Thermoanaerobaculia bacterium]|nr:hypothetical protein [Thermoanaerobaculia bacterium]
MVPFVSLAAIAVAAFLSWSLYRRFGSDRIEALVERRRKTSRFVSRGSFVDGSRQLDVALALDQSTFFYENRDMAASIDLQWVREIEYDTKLATGAAAAGGKILRLRSQSQTFEFVLPDDVVARWHTMLPQRPSAVRAN